MTRIIRSGCHWNTAVRAGLIADGAASSEARVFSVVPVLRRAGCDGFRALWAKCVASSPSAKLQAMRSLQRASAFLQDLQLAV